MPTPKKDRADAKRRARAPILTPDSRLGFPEFVLLKASAGSGKTHALSLRFVQFLLSDILQKQAPCALANILAITFTRLAAREMKERILDWLKKCYFRDPGKTAEVLEIVSLDRDALPGRAAEVIDAILSRYTDFQVETIDSFMATIFRASAVDLGLAPDFEIVLDHGELIDYAFSSYLRKVRSGSDDGAVFQRILDYLLLNLGQDAPFPWDPTGQVREKIISLYGKLAAQTQTLDVADFEAQRADLRRRIGRAADELQALIDGGPWDRYAKTPWFDKILPAVRENRFADLIECRFYREPVRKPKQPGSQEAYEKIVRSWSKLERLVAEYRVLHARDFFTPYLLAYGSLAGTLDLVKRQQGVVFIEDINKRLAGYMAREGIVPDIYFRLGERVFHYLIDEFQDTSPIQWANLRPLIENSLAQGGSLFAVGDTKQAIYGFRDADYKIMKALEDRTDGFESAEVQVSELRENYRCRPAVLDFVKRVFLERAKESAKYRDIALQSGLTEFHQDVSPGIKNPGYVEYVLLTRDTDSGEDEAAAAEGQESPAADPERPERTELQNRVLSLRQRGYACSDIAVLTYKNEDVVRISSWLNEINIPIIPFSSLDIRRRKIIGEILALLQFLDSPPDDLSFSIFLMGDMLRSKLDRDGLGRPAEFWHRFLFEHRQAADRPLYAAFRNRFPELWDRTLERLFKNVGYYPLYDLVTLIYRVFDVFALFPQEESALVRLLEVIKDFEGLGRNDLREFLEYTGQEGTDDAWTIDVPSAIDAVRIMSIHKAKGLGFPVVILLLYHEQFISPDLYLDADAEHVRVYRLKRALAEADERLKRIYDAERLKAEVNRLNTLYVALTRAKAELHVIAVKGKRGGFPFDLLGQGESADTEEGKGTQAGRDVVYRRPERMPSAFKEAPPPVAAEAVLHRFSGPFDIPANPRESLNAANIRRGEHAHRIMSELEYIRSDWSRDLEEIGRRLGPTLGEDRPVEEVAAALACYFQESPLAAYFVPRPGRRVWRELEVCDAEGRVFRMDRVIADPDAVTVIDYKTGTETNPQNLAQWDAEDREQVRAYIRLLKDLFPRKPVRGILVRIDRGTQETVE